MNRRWLWIALTLTACGASGAANGASPAVPTGEPLAAKPADAARPVAPGDLEVALDGARWTGPLRDHEQARALPMTLTVRNDTREPLSLGPTLARIEVLERGTRVDGCSASEVLEEVPPVLGPSAAVVARVQLPCALPDEGDYVVSVVLAPGHDDTDDLSVDDVRFATTTTVTVDDDSGAYGLDVMPAARIYAPHPTTLAPPAPFDVRPEPPLPPSGERARTEYDVDGEH